MFAAKGYRQGICWNQVLAQVLLLRQLKVEVEALRHQMKMNGEEGRTEKNLDVRSEMLGRA